ncbi:14099_t:CDS:2 [Entrophospora sp. SA101]|nr:14099_t:CDS:2 [Entrophospora sp. SA101]
MGATIILSVHSYCGFWTSVATFFHNYYWIKFSTKNILTTIDREMKHSI